MHARMETFVTHDFHSAFCLPPPNRRQEEVLNLIALIYAFHRGLSDATAISQHPLRRRRLRIRKWTVRGE